VYGPWLKLVDSELLERLAAERWAEEDRRLAALAADHRVNGNSASICLSGRLIYTVRDRQG
jgi:hypothetical protein